MDDVDRLFECFKCGVSPPESAVRERKRSKTKPKQDSPVSAHKPDKFATDGDPLRLTTVKGSKGSHGKQISPVVFYGSPHGVPPKRPISLLRLLSEIRIDLAQQQELKLRKDVWATFPRQNEAMNFAKQHADVHVFSYQDHHNGQRRFLVSTYQEFWRRYQNMDCKFRHHYEVIEEGLPCHLYFDLEFNKRENEGKNGDEMVDLLMSVILEVLLDKYAIEGNQDWVVELDSSTAEKFSRHLIIRIPKVAFKDNSHVGSFVAEICSRISSAMVQETRFASLFVIKDSTLAGHPSQLFVDTAVYTRNRCFRLALSSKAGKNSVLLPTGRFHCKDMCEEDMFMASLICNMDADCEKLLVCKVDTDCVKTLHFDTEVNHDYKRCSFSQELPFNGWPSDAANANMTGKSPFPALDKFVESIASSGTISGKIRSWYWFSEYGLMVYSMSRNRYCERIGRQHKSNHVMYVVDFRRAAYYQKCHDPDCQGYRSSLRPIPMNIIPDPNSAKTTHEMGLGNDIKYQYVNSDCEALLLCGDEHVTKSCGKDSWWLEAVKVADDIEKRQKTLRVGKMESMGEGEGEGDWWIAVERTASHNEELTPVKLQMDTQSIL